ncbi:MAG TPA: LptF/LptG family permease [Gemmataceae bacterium]|nr:LptF/LptG family permease [Gemmataceae bacterium]
MFVSILQRMILWELVKVFFLSLLAITGILLMAGIVAEASQQGLGPMQVLEIIPLLIPSTLPYTLPATTLFATCVVYGRLAADNEVLAIKAAGVNIMKVLWPGVLLGVVMSCATMGLYYRIIPYTHHLMRTLFLNDVKEVMYSLLKKDKGISNPRLDFIMSVRDVQGRKLLDATFQHRNKADPHVHDFVIRAREAELEVNVPRHVLIVKMRDGEVSNPKGEHVLFESKVEEIDLPPIWDSGHVARARDLSWKQLGEHRAALLEKIDDLGRQEEEAEEQLQEPGAPSHLEKHAVNLKQARETLWGGIHQIDAELQMRPALSFGCLCFVLIGCPVGIWFSRSDYLSAFITCFLPIVFVYYPLMLCGTNFAKEGKFHPVATVWAADALAAFIGVVLFSRLLKN